jgi:hypothetical protein
MGGEVTRYRGGANHVTRPDRPVTPGRKWPRSCHISSTLLDKYFLSSKMATFISKYIDRILRVEIYCILVMLNAVTSAYLRVYMILIWRGVWSKICCRMFAVRGFSVIGNPKFSFRYSSETNILPKWLSYEKYCRRGRW